MPKPYVAYRWLLTKFFYTKPIYLNNGGIPYNANAIGQLKEGDLVDFFRRISFKKGRATAVSALARKLAVIIWNMVTKGISYNPPTPYLFLDEKRKFGMVKRIFYLSKLVRFVEAKASD